MYRTVTMTVEMACRRDCGNPGQTRAHEEACLDRVEARGGGVTATASQPRQSLEVLRVSHSASEQQRPSHGNAVDSLSESTAYRVRVTVERRRRSRRRFRQGHGGAAGDFAVPKRYQSSYRERE
jgi:hypothetical protein